jgi:tripartite-type tricarboxylate transporter receptor subunit TctC
METALRTLSIARLALLVVPLFVAQSWAQDYPVKPIRLVVPFAAGGGTDMIARSLAQKMTEAWGQPVVVENRAGGTGAVGSTIVAKAPADGYVLLLVTSSTHAIWPSIQTDLPYHPVRDFAAVSLAATGPQVMVVHPSVPVSTVKELVTLAKARPGTLFYASPGTGTAGHMTGELFKTVTGTNIVHVPYKGTASVMTDLLSGYVQMLFGGPGSMIPHVNSRKLKALAVAYSRRTAGLEQVPTFAEAGYPGVDATQWYGVLTTGGTPQPVVDKLNREIVRILQLPEVKERFLASGYVAAPSTPQEFTQLLRDELAKWQKVVKATGVRPD